jgi:hypothetical protein
MGYQKERIVMGRIILTFILKYHRRVRNGLIWLGS